MQTRIRDINFITMCITCIHIHTHARARTIVNHNSFFFFDTQIGALYYSPFFLRKKSCFFFPIIHRFIVFNWLYLLLHFFLKKITKKEQFRCSSR